MNFSLEPTIPILLLIAPKMSFSFQYLCGAGILAGFSSWFCCSSMYMHPSCIRKEIKEILL